MFYVITQPFLKILSSNFAHIGIHQSLLSKMFGFFENFYFKWEIFENEKNVVRFSFFFSKFSELQKS